MSLCQKGNVVAHIVAAHNVVAHNIAAHRVVVLSVVPTVLLLTVLLFTLLFPTFLLLTVLLLTMLSLTLLLHTVLLLTGQRRVCGTADQQAGRGRHHQRSGGSLCGRFQELQGVSEQGVRFRGPAGASPWSACAARRCQGQIVTWSGSVIVI